MRGNTPLSRPRTLLAIAAGLLVFAAGAALALLFLPEWRVKGPAEGREAFAHRFRHIAREAGLRPAPGEPRVSLATSQRQVYGILGEEAPAWLAETRTGLVIEATHAVEGGAGGAPRPELTAVFSSSGQPRRLSWEDLDLSLTTGVDREQYERLARVFGSLLVAPGESLGSEREHRSPTSPPWWMIDLEGSRPGQHLGLTANPPNAVAAERRPLRFAQRPGNPNQEIWRFLSVRLLSFPVLLAAVGVFFFLFLRGRIGLANGAILALAALLSASPDWITGLPKNVYFAVVFLLFQVPGTGVYADHRL